MNYVTELIGQHLKLYMLHSVKKFFDIKGGGAECFPAPCFCAGDGASKFFFIAGDHNADSTTASRRLDNHRIADFSSNFSGLNHAFGAVVGDGIIAARCYRDVDHLH